ncbi:MAG: PTS sugar transporter subunit IIB [Cetobacterium sp.]|nr:PTS sugar transporter subunit IIB [Cetobacterium sp.]
MVKLLAVCGNGMGTSMLMKLKAKGILDKYKIQNTCENCSIGQAKSGIGAYDIVIASTHLASQLKPNGNTKIISLKNILDVKEMENRIMEILK